MSTEGLPDELRVLGLGAEAVAVYACLLESGPLAPEDLAARLDCPAPAVGDGAEELRHAGPVAKRAGPAGEVGYAPVAPETGLEVLALRKQSELQLARLAATRAYEALRRTAYVRMGHDLHDVPGGGVQIANAVETIGRGIQKQLANGIKYRVVYSQASLARPGFVTENIRPCVLAGGCSRPPGAPLDPTGTASAPRLRGDDSKMLSLLAAGLADDIIARELGISRRTYFRRLSALMARAGASNRFQLALHAARDNWC